MAVKQYKISIVTATFDAALNLPQLIKCLRDQSDHDFEWVVADGASTDGTLELLEAVKDIDLIISSQPDFGIYDALNRAIKLSTGDYYIVLGADDLLLADSIASFRNIINEQSPDLVSAKVMVGDHPAAKRRHWPWLYGAFAYVNSHAVGTMIKKSLHDRFGYYSRFYPIVADQLFIKRAGDAGMNIVLADFVSGQFGMHGCSGSDVLGVLTESYRVQLATGENKLVQTVLLLARLVRNFRRL